MIPWLFAALALPAIALGLAIVDPGALFALGFIPIVAALALWVAIAGSRLSVAGLARTYAIPGATAVTLMVGALLVGGLIPEIAQRTARDMVDQPFNVANVLRASALGLAGLWALGSYGLGPAGSAAGWHYLLRRPQVYYLAFALIAVGSAAYASSPLASLSKSVEIAVVAFVMGAIVRHVHAVPGLAFERALGLWNLTLALTALALFALLLGAMADPATGMQPLPGAFLPVRLVGGVLQIHPNTSGQLGATLAVVGLNRGLRLRRPAESVFWLGIMALGLVVLTLAQARTSVAAVLIAVPLVLFLNRRFVLGSLFALISLVGAALMIQTLLDYILRGQSIEQFMTGTGRTGIWEVAWDMVEKAPLLGGGFYTSVRIDLTERYRILDLSNVDNTPLEVLVGVGIVGTVPFVLFVASFVRRVLGNLAPPAYRGLYIEVLATLIIMGFRMAFGPTVQVFSFSLLIVTVLAAFAGPLRPPARVPVAR